MELADRQFYVQARRGFRVAGVPLQTFRDAANEEEQQGPQAKVLRWGSRVAVVGMEYGSRGHFYISPLRSTRVNQESFDLLLTWGEPMKQKHLVRLAAFLVGVMGGAAFGDDHVGGPPEDCSRYPWWCQGQCAELNACRSGNTPFGGSDCQTQETNLALCEISPPPYVPTVPTVPVVIVVPPSPCPAGQQLNEGECQADHECGDDEIGGGSEECEACPDGTESNEAGTACEPDGSYTVARCSRPLAGMPEAVARYLPYHENAVSESMVDANSRKELGFFALDMSEALARQRLYISTCISQAPHTSSPAALCSPRARCGRTPIWGAASTNQ